ncbi:leucine-rich repeat serine/threonine-protein kinase 1-like, partial [Hoplias malabaricus]|uniref:leucine-rich repeat serine/threonine-protein kinase 1-like n=1 Tax=Hoplias malabaricus TaxID=27720 RepID=UPI00346222FF
MSYWNVGDAEDTEAQPCSTMEHTGGTEMGAKQSGAGGAPLGQSPTLENIRAAYRDQECCRAQELIRISCQDNGTGRPHGLELLCVASQHGDIESVRFLLNEARVQFPQEPGEGNPAILAAHYGQHAVAKELLDSIP